MQDKVGVKGILLGNTAVGKTSFISATNEMSIENIHSTTGIEFTKIEIDGTDYVLNLFDTAGQEQFRSLAISYYRDVQIAIFITTCKEDTQEADDKSLIEFISNAREYGGDSFHSIFLLNKIDLINDEDLLNKRMDAVKTLLETRAGISENVTLIPVSCQTRAGIEDVWAVIKDIVTSMNLPPPKPGPTPIGPDPKPCNC